MLLGGKLNILPCRDCERGEVFSDAIGIVLASRGDGDIVELKEGVAGGGGMAEEESIDSCW